MSLYDVLGLDRGASAATVQRAYRRLVRRYHPDLNPGNEEAARRYADVTRAFDVLGDPARRRLYDEGGDVGTTGPSAEVAFAGFDFSVTVEGGAATTFGDLFVDVFRAAADSRTPAAGSGGGDVHADVVLTLEDVIRGASRTIPVARRLPCQVCSGSGRVEHTAVRCASCRGDGQLRLARGHMTFVRPCEACAGEGLVRHGLCPGCHGTRVQTRIDPHVVHLPAGVGDGEEWRERGQGHPAVGGAPAGDLRIRVSVVPDGRWQRRGDDLHVTVPVAIHEAVLGTRLDLDTPDGSVRLRVPPGTQGGQRLRLRERGVPSRRTGIRGDLVVTVQLVLPRVIDARGRALMAEFARLHPDDVRKDFELDEAG